MSEEKPVLMTKAREIAAQLEGVVVDLLPGINTLSNREFAQMVDAACNSKTISIQGQAFVGNKVNPIDVSLLAFRVENPSEFTIRMHDNLVKLAEQGEKNDPAIGDTIKALQTDSASALKLSGLVESRQLAALPNTGSMPAGTSVSHSGAGGPGGVREIG
ncbi:MAG: hypothetical protein K2X09_07855 [Rickettsiales bacterium]|nr:hypothetical protein [Rickettsiales bacterium]